MGKQVPHSATSIVTADPMVDINKIKVSPEIYNKMALKDPENDKVLLWRDPAYMMVLCVHLVLKKR